MNDNSVIILFKKVLEFYANSNNYIETNNGKSYVELDGGEQARFVLKQVDDIEKTTNIYDFDYFQMNNSGELINEIIKIKDDYENIHKIS